MIDILLASVVLLLVLLIILLLRSRSELKQVRAELMENNRHNRDDINQQIRELRQDTAHNQKATMENLIKVMTETNQSQQQQSQLISEHLNRLSESNEKRLDKLRQTVAEQLLQIQENNERKLNQMRELVDEKLQSTLEKRLGESFKRVSERLEAVQRGLGEMQSLATGVGDLKKVLSNVKARGTWGEVQLEAILEQILTVDQYEKNVNVQDNSREMVDFAIRLPGQGNNDESVWLPLDSKFPQEDYIRLVEASEKSDKVEVEKAQESLRKAIIKSARDIQQKYVHPPQTTDFAILFLPTEGLYAEILRRQGLLEEIQRQYRIVIAGPATLSAILNSLRMGFRTLAIEKRSSEVWQILAGVKAEFGKFGDVLDKLKKQLHTASNTIEESGRRSRAIERKLRDVEALPIASDDELLSLEAHGDE